MSPTDHDEELEALDRLRRAKQKRIEADAEEAMARADLQRIMARQDGRRDAGGATVAVSSVSAVPLASTLPPLPRGERGQGDRIVQLLREKPRAGFGWLSKHVYGEDTPDNRQTLASLIGYLANTKKVLRRVGDGEYVVIERAQ